VTRAAFQALISHWRRSPLQLLIVVVGLALATGLWTGVQAINAEARASYVAAETTLNSGTRDRIERRDGAPIQPAEFATLRRLGWLVSPMVDTTYRADGRTYRLIGIDPFTLPAASSPVGFEDVDQFEDLLDGRILLAAPDVDLPDVETVAREGIADGTIIGDIARIWQLTGEETITNFTVLDAQPAGQSPLPDAYRLIPATDPTQDVSRLTDSFHLNLTAFGFLSFGVGLFIVQAAIGLAFEQRRGVVRTLRSLGVPLRAVMGLFAAETLLLAIVSGIIGVGLGYVVAAALLPDVAATLRGLYGAQVAGGLSLKPSWIASGFVMALAGAIAATSQSLWQLSIMPLLAPKRPRAWALASMSRLGRLAIFGLVIWVCAALAAAFGSGLIMGFFMLGALLLGAAFVLPAILAWAVGIAADKSGGTMTRWIWSDTRQQIPGLSLALMALLLALAANIGVGTMVQSFRTTFTGWLDQRLAAELYVSAESDARGDALVAFLEDRSDAVLPIRSIETSILGHPAEVFGVRDHATYRDHWPLLRAQPSTWDAVAAGSGVLVNEQLFRREALRLGETLDLQPGWSLPVVGVYSDYGNPLAQAIVGLELLEARHSDLSRTQYAVRVPTEQATNLRLALVDEFGLPPGNILDQASVKAFSMDIFNRTFIVSGALNVLTLGVAAFALLASLATLATLRLPQLAPVWAMGLTRRDMGIIEVIRALLLALMTWLLAIPVGLALAWVLLAVVNVEAFGWRLPLQLFPSQWVTLGFWACIAALIAALFPALRLSRMEPSKLVAVFANER